MRNRWKAILLVVAMMMVSPGISIAKTDYLMLGSSSASSSHYSYSVGAAKAINTYVKGVKVNVVETGASVDNLKRLRAGQIDLGIGGHKVMYEAWKGLGRWKESPYPDLRILWVYAKTIDYIVVRADSGVEKLEDLNGKKFNPGIRGSATESTTKQIFEILGVKPDYHIGGTSDAVKALKDGRIVGYVKTGIGTQLDASTLDIMTLTKVCLIPLSEKNIVKISQTLPYVSIITVKKGEIKAMPEQPDYSSWGMPTVVECLKTLPEEKAYQFVKAIVKGREFQTVAFPACKFVDFVKDTTTLCKVPLHAGAVKAYRELGAESIPSEIVPPEAK